MTPEIVHEIMQAIVILGFFGLLAVIYMKAQF